jgi:hypothetical protein
MVHPAISIKIIEEVLGDTILTSALPAPETFLI